MDDLNDLAFVSNDFEAKVQAEIFDRIACILPPLEARVRKGHGSPSDEPSHTHHLRRNVAEHAICGPLKMGGLYEAAILADLITTTCHDCQQKGYRATK